MTWLTWRQHRQQLAVFAVVFLSLAALFAVLRQDLESYVHHSGLLQCLAKPDEGCGDLLNGLKVRYPSLLDLLPYLNLAPVLVGVFVGAPLVTKELESGTYRLVWTQAVSRRRWLLTKLGAISLGCVLGGLALGALDRWFFEPYISGAAVSPVGADTIGLIGLAPAAYLLFAFAVGTAAGALVRRTLPAMGIALVVFVATRLIWENQRYRVLTPLKAVFTMDGQPVAGLPGTTVAAPGRQDWVLPVSPWVDAAGHPLDDQQFNAWCGTQAGKQAFEACLGQHGVHTAQSWEPASRYWTFQWLDVAIFGGVALLLLAATVRATLRRSS
jgi:hypothetical protein